MFTEAATYVVIRADLRLVLVEVARRRLVASGSPENHRATFDKRNQDF
jgi:hypothetical protein